MNTLGGPRNDWWVSSPPMTFNMAERFKKLVVRSFSNLSASLDLEEFFFSYSEQYDIKVT
jgi:hypothetical protein